MAEKFVGTTFTKWFFRNIFRNDKKRPLAKSPKALNLRGGGSRDRTGDLLNAIVSFDLLLIVPSLRSLVNTESFSNLLC